MPGLLTVFFSADPVQDFAGAQACDTEAYARFCRALLDRGVYPPASQFEAWFPSLAHDEASIDRTIEAAARGLPAGHSLTRRSNLAVTHGHDLDLPRRPVGAACATART